MPEIYIVKDCYGRSMDELNEFNIGVCSTIERALDLIKRKAACSKRTFVVEPTIDNWKEDCFSYREECNDPDDSYVQFYDIEVFVLDQDWAALDPQ